MADKTTGTASVTQLKHFRNMLHDLGSETAVFCASDYSIEGKSGKFYRNCEEYTSKYNFDKEIETKLWEVSEELVKARKPL